MTCKEMNELIPDLAAGIEQAAPELDEHIRACADCAKKMNEFRQTMALLDEWQVPEPSPYFDTRLNARLREEMASQPKGWLQWLRKPALAISLSLLMVVSATLIRFGGSHDGSSNSGEATIVAQGEAGSAVSDLQALDKNPDLYSDFDVLDDLTVQQDVNANP